MGDFGKQAILGLIHGFCLLLVERTHIVAYPRLVLLIFTPLNKFPFIYMSLAVDLPLVYYN